MAILALLLALALGQGRAEVPRPGWSRPVVTPRSALPIKKGPIMFVAPEAACPAWKGKPVRLGTIVDPPLLTYVEPRRPSSDVSGTVILEASIAPDGTVGRVKPLREVSGLTEEAIDAVRKWRYARTCANGVPIPFIKTIALSYRD